MPSIDANTEDEFKKLGTSDKFSGTFSDPTYNVMQLVGAAVKRQDDLHLSEFKRVDEALQHLKDMALLRAEHSSKMNEKESDRLDAIRQVDVLAGNTQAVAAATAIQALAATTTTNAENIRSTVVSTAATMANQLTNTVAGINERLAALERSSYEGIGKGRVADPQMAELVQEMKSMLRNQATGTGKSEGANATVAYVITAIMTLIAIAGFVLAAFKT